MEGAAQGPSAATTGCWLFSEDVPVLIPGSGQWAELCAIVENGHVIEIMGREEDGDADGDAVHEPKNEMKIEIRGPPSTPSAGVGLHHQVPPLLLVCHQPQEQTIPALLPPPLPPAPQ